MAVPKVGLVTLNLNQRDLTLTCLKAMKALTYPNLETIVVDNGSTDGTAEAVRKAFPEVVVVELKSNTGFTGGMNAGIVEAAKRGADYVYVLNNDTLYPDPQLVDKIIAAMEKDPKIGLGGGKVVDYDNANNVQWVGPEITVLGRHDVPGCAFMCRTAMLRDVGLLDTVYHTYYEETDLFVRSQRKGWKGVYVEDAVIQHMRGSPATGNLSVYKAYTCARNFFIYARKNAQGFRSWNRMFWKWHVDSSVYNAWHLMRKRRWKPLWAMVKGQFAGIGWMFRKLPPEPRLPV